MTIAIVRNAISQLDAFCDVRNNRSLAHDNRLLERSESRLIVRQISALVEFVNELESELAPGEEIGH